LDLNVFKNISSFVVMFLLILKLSQSLVGINKERGQGQSSSSWVQVLWKNPKIIK
jgi:hypothetical protein